MTPAMQRILIQLDTDPQPSVFDRVVAVDAGVEHIFTYGGVTPETVTPLVHGAIFTRGPKDLKNTAIFVGGSDAAAGDALVKAIRKACFGPMRVSILCDSNGSNTTAAAAIRAAARHLDLSTTRALVLGGTGPVGQRAARILCRQGAEVVLASRSQQRAEECAAGIREAVPAAKLKPITTDAATIQQELSGTHLLIAAGAAGVQFLSADQWRASPDLRVAIDLNAVPPLGLDGIQVTDAGVAHGAIMVYGAIGVGGTKMKVHRKALQALFEANDRVLLTEEVYDIARQLPE
jgi:hypothetical protein